MGMNILKSVKVTVLKMKCPNCGRVFKPHKKRRSDGARRCAKCGVEYRLPRP